MALEHIQMLAVIPIDIYSMIVRKYRSFVDLKRILHKQVTVQDILDDRLMFVDRTRIDSLYDSILYRHN